MICSGILPLDTTPPKGNSQYMLCNNICVRMTEGLFAFYLVAIFACFRCFALRVLFTFKQYSKCLFSVVVFGLFSVVVSCLFSVVVSCLFSVVVFGLFSVVVSCLFSVVVFCLSLETVLRVLLVFRNRSPCFACFQKPFFAFCLFSVFCSLWFALSLHV